MPDADLAGGGTGAGSGKSRVEQIEQWLFHPSVHPTVLQEVFFRQVQEVPEFEEHEEELEEEGIRQVRRHYQLDVCRRCIRGAGVRSPSARRHVEDRSRQTGTAGTSETGPLVTKGPS